MGCKENIWRQTQGNNGRKPVPVCKELETEVEVYLLTGKMTRCILLKSHWSGSNTRFKSRPLSDRVIMQRLDTDIRIQMSKLIEA